MLLKTQAMTVSPVRTEGCGNQGSTLESESVNCSVMSVCDPMTCSLLGSSVHGILQARILE